MKPILEIKQVGNNEVITFNASNKMKLFAFTFYADSNLKGKDPEVIAQNLGYRKDIFTVWRREFNPHFEEWFETAGATFRKDTNKKNLLEFVGMERALDGDFNFWKQLAIREKVITPDQIIHNILPIDLGAYDKFSPKDIESHANSLLDSLLPMGDQAIVDVASEISAEGSKGNDGGATALPEFCVEVPAQVCQD